MTTTEPLGQPDPGFTPIQEEILQTIHRLTQEYQYPPSMREVLACVNLTAPSALWYEYDRLKAKGHLRSKPKRQRTVEVRLPDQPSFFAVPGEISQPAGDGPGTGETVGDARREKVAWVPVVGEIRAGTPALAQQQPVWDYLPLPRDVVGGQDEDLFVLQVTRDSMSGAGIFPGDWVVVRRLFEAPQHGDIVAADIDGAVLAEIDGTVSAEPAPNAATGPGSRAAGRPGRSAAGGPGRAKDEIAIVKYVRAGRDIFLMAQNPAWPPIRRNRARIRGKVVVILRRV